MPTLRGVKDRIIRDYGRLDLLDFYADVLRVAVDEGYRIISVRDLADLSSSPPDHKYLVLRHDVDVSPSVARRFREIELEYGANATYYFRLCTVDLPLMQWLEDSQADVAYHSEELATVMKATGVSQPADVVDLVPVARELAAFNVKRFRSLISGPLTHVSSHGDFTNSRSGVTNARIYDTEFKKRAGLDFEAYDLEVNRLVQLRVADMSDPLEAALEVTEGIRSAVPVIYFLSHPRRWKSSPSESATEDLYRLVEGLIYSRGAQKRRVASPNLVSDEFEVDLRTPNAPLTSSSSMDKTTVAGE